MSAFIQVPVKKTWDVDVTRPIYAFMMDAYTDLQPSDYRVPIGEFHKLRSNFVAKLSDKSEATLDLMYRYCDQLNAIEGKLPIAENQLRIDFIWQDAFSKKMKTIASAAYEKASVLFVIGAMQTQVANSQDLRTDDGLKLAAKLFQQASGIFTHIVSIMHASLPVAPTRDLSPDALSVLSALMLAEAQECFVRKAIRDAMKPAVVAKLSNQCSFLYADALKQMQADAVKSVWPKEWPGAVTVRREVFLAIAEQHQAAADKDARKYGECLARLRVARDRIAAAEKVAGGFPFAEYQKAILSDLQQADKENGMVYHVRVPDASSLGPIDKAVVAKPAPVNSPMSSSFTDLFGNIMPMAVLDAVSSFEARKSEILCHELGRLRDATRTLNAQLIANNLPAAVEDLSGRSVPPSLLTKAATVRQFGGIEYLSRLNGELPQLLQRNKQLLDQAERELGDEEAGDRQLRAQFGPLWSRTPSEVLSAPIRHELARYRSIISNAISSDGMMRQRFSSHRNAIALLSQSDTDIERTLPAGSPAAELEWSPVVSTLRQLVDEAQIIKDDRDSIERQLKDVKCDMAGKFLSSLMQGGTLNEAALCSQQLDRMYGPLREQVAQSLKRQDNVLRQLKEACTELNRVKEQSSTPSARERQLRDLATAYDSFIDLKNNIEEGTQFYNELTDMLVKCQTKISEFCAARDAEKDALLQDVSMDVVHQPMSPPPQMTACSHSHPLQVPAYHQHSHQHSAGITRAMNKVTIGSGPSGPSAGYGGGMYGGHSATFYTLGMRSHYNPYAKPSTTYQWH